MNSIIIGASALGREIHSFNKQIKESSCSIVAFLDDNLNALDFYEDQNLPRIRGKIDSRNVFGDEDVILGISNSGIKKTIVDSWDPEIKFRGFIFPNVIIGERTILGKGIVMMPNALISCDCTVEDFVFINCGSQIGHDVKIGKYTSIMANVDIGGGAEIGEGVTIGSGATILPKVKIPDNTIIGAGSIVIRTIKQPGTYFGSPAKKIF